jgi:outer membrane protein TolC
VDATTTRRHSALYGDTAVTSRAGLTVNQALLQGLGPAVNLVAVNQARLDLDISRYELRGYTLALVAEVEMAYWDHALAEQQVAITARALTVARQQLEQIRAYIATGKLAGVEIAAAEAEVAVRNGYAIDARSQRELTRLNLLRLIDAPGPGSLERPVALVDRPFIPEVVMDAVATHVTVALRLRPDLNQARLQASRGDLTLVQTRNGLLPQLDLFATLGRTGYGESFSGSTGSRDGRAWDAEVGARFAYALGNRAAGADHRRALVSREQLAAALSNQEHLAEVDVRGACIELERAREQVTATAATVRAQEEKARAEREKFLNQKSTALLVAQAERDALASRIEEVRAVVRYLKDLVDLYRLDGSLLERRGVVIPGADVQERPNP